MITEKVWVIVGKHGLYFGTWATRGEAIDAHVRALYGDPNSYSEAWRQCRARGDRAVRATVSYGAPAPDKETP